MEQAGPLRVEAGPTSHGSVEEIAMFGPASVARRYFRFRYRLRSEGAGVVACASVMPIAVLALAV